MSTSDTRIDMDELPSPAEVLANFRPEDHTLVMLTIGMAMLTGDTSLVDKLNLLPLPDKEEPHE